MGGKAFSKISSMNYELNKTEHQKRLSKYKRCINDKRKLSIEIKQKEEKKKYLDELYDNDIHNAEYS